MAEKEVSLLSEDEVAASEALERELSQMSGVQRAAVLMLLLGEQQAAEIIRFLNPKEVQALGGAMMPRASRRRPTSRTSVPERSGCGPRT